MSSLWLENNNFKLITVEADKWFPLETGGLLIGYRADNGEIVITDITVAGPNAIHKKSQFIPDYDFDQNVVEEAFHRTGGICNYLGDWHTHPNGNGFLSWPDKRTMRSISQSTEAYLSSPTMGILFGKSGSWELAAHELSKGASKWLLGRRYNYRSLCVNKFDKSL